jgi:lysozyme
MKPFLDISGFQRNISHVDWVGIARHFQGCGIKATEGQSFLDPEYHRHAAGARSAGVKFTPYHFARPDHNSPSEEVTHFLSVIHETPLIPTLDIEVSTRVNVDQWVHEFCQIMRKRGSKTPIIYTYSGYLSHFTRARGNGLWIANYNRNDGRLHPIGSPAPWKTFRLHQYTSEGRTPYVDGHVDLSVIRIPQSWKGMQWAPLT